MITNLRSGLMALALLAVSSAFTTSVAQQPPAYGQLNATIGCDLVEGTGLVVTVLDEVSRVHMQNHFGIDVALGDACLPALAQFPPPLVRLATVLENSDGGPSDPIQSCLIWILQSGNVAQVDLPGIGSLFQSRRRAAVCDVGEGELNTVFVTGTDYQPQSGETCGETRGVLSLGGAKSSGPIAVKLLNDGTQAFGGLLFTGVAQDAVEVMACNVNSTGDDLVITYFEDENGPDASLVGQSCLETMSAREEATGSLKFGAPTALPASSETTDPGCLIWDIDGGTILETG